MASFRFSSGKRGQILAELVKKHNYNTKATYTTNEAGVKCIAQIEAPCLTITREMISKAYFGGKPEYEASIDMWLNHFVLNANGKVIYNAHDKIIICDDDSDKAMSLRMKINHQMDIARFSEKLQISRNIRAIEHYVQYLSSTEEMEE
ncbi:MAG: hypothetical protein ACOX6S_01430 [Clostridia bacterium]|jgi:hypothetical protein